MVGGYTLVSRLGTGAMGSVWRVRDDGGQIYAMKILRDSLSDEGDGRAAQQDPSLKENVTARERLRREALALQKIHHPGVCGIVDMELDDALAFIVTELIEGKNLKEDVETNGAYVGNDLERLASKLIDAVKAVHAAGIVHRDIKPTNVMVSATGPVLVDFGIAMGEDESHVTRTGLVMGTPGFIAPEVIDGAESSEETDWWSTASVLAFAATGKPVFGTKPMMAVLERAAAGNAHLAGLPPHTITAFRSALNPDAHQRCTPDQLVHAIALDALNPLAWQSSDTGSNADANTSSNTSETEVVRPFDPSSPGQAAQPSEPSQQTLPAQAQHSDDPRTIWLSSTDGNREGSAAAMPVPAEQCTVTLASDRLGPKDVPGTTVLPAALPARLEPAQPVQPAREVAQQPMPVQSPVQQLPVQPVQQPQQPVQPPSPNPADIKRGQYLTRGALPLALLAAIPALAALLHPVAGVLVATLLFWLLLTVGSNIESQLERESRRGGVRKGTDTALRLLSLPWHLVKAAVWALGRALLFACVDIAAVVTAALILQLPWAMTPLPIDIWPHAIPWLTDGPLSITGLTLACMAAVSWLLTAFWPHATTLRLGAGRLFAR
ncbi:Protein kinase domain [Bifidobacterium sp. DSM 109963]|uniref:non-specific serine/threonine protein kinase n=2 Tax=Bifidobacterium panos TaxID=2675321 RepID=A0ABX1SXZ1_9BIFI|nr:Protein kinase domain [Bifidobacterium sp. DSM 109963]